MQIVLSESCFDKFATLIHDLTGITIGRNRISMVEGRLRKRVTTLGIKSYEEYLQLVRSDKTEQGLFVDFVTTNETYFFRTPRIWEYIEKQYLPEWYAKNPKRVFMVWSAAASSGEEAHSLGIVCQAFKEKNPNFLFKVFGTDISQEMIEKCRLGHYSGRSVEMLGNSRPEYFAKYMQQVSDGVFQVSPVIKARLAFQQHNLFKPLLKMDQFDLVLIRNVLIYFTGEDQEKVLSLLAPRMFADSHLIIGESESLSHIKTPFVHKQPLIYGVNQEWMTQKKAG
ncbi:MAG: protein-glutamate O-methyltransferase CheR [Bdellovibrionales bacterium]|jgi:chemotaxis protein methyltransferase CheR|nr:protein-glutamate O-methyltransferase CheR [Bdellovibrionales bacterium]